MLLATQKTGGNGLRRAIGPPPGGVEGRGFYPGRRRVLPKSVAILRYLGRMRPFIVSVALLGLVSAVPAEDRDQGKGDRIERREEWFFSTRRAGTTSPAEM